MEVSKTKRDGPMGPGSMMVVYMGPLGIRGLGSFIVELQGETLQNNTGNHLNLGFHMSY